MTTAVLTGARGPLGTRVARILAEAGDLLMLMTVSGNSPNLVKAIDWANAHGLTTIGLVGGKGGVVAEKAQSIIRIDDSHYGRVEDAHMLICHLLCYSYMEKTDL